MEWFDFLLELRGDPGGTHWYDYVRQHGSMRYDLAPDCQFYDHRPQGMWRFATGAEVREAFGRATWLDAEASPFVRPVMGYLHLSADRRAEDVYSWLSAWSGRLIRTKDGIAFDPFRRCKFPLDTAQSKYGFFDGNSSRDWEAFIWRTPRTS